MFRKTGDQQSGPSPIRNMELDADFINSDLHNFGLEVHCVPQPHSTGNTRSNQERHGIFVLHFKKRFLSHEENGNGQIVPTLGFIFQRRFLSHTTKGKNDVVYVMELHNKSEIIFS